MTAQQMGSRPGSLPSGCLSLAVLAGILVLFPFFLAEAMLEALARLGLTPRWSAALALGVFLGGLVNIPIRRVPRDELIEVVPTGLFGVERWAPRLVRRRSFAVLAVNLGGCVLPAGLAVYQLARIAAAGGPSLGIAIGAIALDSAACYWVARPVPRVGVVLRPIVPAAIAALCGALFGGELAAPIAFSAGVLGPLVGADLLHLRELMRSTVGVASIGGAGTFDGIVLSGLVATLLA